MSTETKERDEIDELLLAEGVLTDEELERVEELLDEAPGVDELEPDEVVQPE